VREIRRSKPIEFGGDGVKVHMPILPVTEHTIVGLCGEPERAKQLCHQPAYVLHPENAKNSAVAIGLFLSAPPSLR